MKKYIEIMRNNAAHLINIEIKKSLSKRRYLRKGTDTYNFLVVFSSLFYLGAADLDIEYEEVNKWMEKYELGNFTPSDSFKSLIQSIYTVWAIWGKESIWMRRDDNVFIDIDTDTLFDLLYDDTQESANEWHEEHIKFIHNELLEYIDNNKFTIDEDGRDFNKFKEHITKDDYYIKMFFASKRDGFKGKLRTKKSFYPQRGTLLKDIKLTYYNDSPFKDFKINNRKGEDNNDKYSNEF